MVGNIETGKNQIPIHKIRDTFSAYEFEAEFFAGFVFLCTPEALGFAYGFYRQHKDLLELPTVEHLYKFFQQQNRNSRSSGSSTMIRT